MTKLQAEPFVFLSYVHTNETIVNRLVADLQKHDVSVWIDHRGILPGTPDWDHTIRTAISTTNAVVLAASPDSRTSLVVRDELQLADRYKCPIYPIWIVGEDWIDAVPLGRGSIQYINARGSSYEKGLLRLVETLKNVLSAPLALPASPQQKQNQVIAPITPLPVEETEQRIPDHLDFENAAGSPHIDWGDALDVPIFFGRTKELKTLEQWIVKEHCRLVAILGMRGIGKTRLSMRLGKGGIGKTDLTLTLARGIQNQFEYVIWRRLLNAPRVTDILADLIRILSNQQEINVPDAVEDQIARLLFYLRQHHCLLILDNAEAILAGGKQAGQYHAGYEGYGQLFRQIAEVPHESCLLLTSREKPQDIARLEGKTRPVRSLELGGLDYLDSEKIFAAIDSFSGSEEEWRNLNELYNGNPLALELAALRIRDAFFGNISEFLREGKSVFADLRELLDWHFDRLSDAQKEVMYWLATNREPMSLSELKEDILSPVAKEQVPSTLQLLQRLLPLEKSATRFTLQPVLMEYMTERLIEQVSEEIKGEKIELFNSHALTKALAKDYIRESQVRLILTSVLERLHTTFGLREIEQKLGSTLLLLRGKHPQADGYASGNILNLLIQLGCDLRSYNFSYLTVRQAYLQDVKLPDVNFAHTSFANSVFTQESI